MFNLKKLDLDYEARLEALYAVLRDKVDDGNAQLKFISGSCKDCELYVYMNDDKFRVHVWESEGENCMKHFKYPLDVIDYIAPYLYSDFIVLINDFGRFEPVIIEYEDGGDRIEGYL